VEAPREGCDRHGKWPAQLVCCDDPCMGDDDGKANASQLDADAQMPDRVDSVPAARAFLIKLLSGWDISDEVIDEASLLTTELMSNAVEHGSGVVDMEIAVHNGLLHVGVHDSSVELPQEGDGTSANPEGGRGIWLVQSIARDWGSDTSGKEPGKTVWFELTTLRTPSP
jgi:anti-sigma regulatory factor (Ser/Thr protein kinase)